MWTGGAAAAEDRDRRRAPGAWDDQLEGRAVDVLSVNHNREGVLAGGTPSKPPLRPLS